MLKRKRARESVRIEMTREMEWMKTKNQNLMYTIKSYLIVDIYIKYKPFQIEMLSLPGIFINS